MRRALVGSYALATGCGLLNRWRRWKLWNSLCKYAKVAETRLWHAWDFHDQSAAKTWQRRHLDHWNATSVHAAEGLSMLCESRISPDLDRLAIAIWAVG